MGEWVRGEWMSDECVGVSGEFVRSECEWVRG